MKTSNFITLVLVQFVSGYRMNDQDNQSSSNIGSWDIQSLFEFLGIPYNRNSYKSDGNSSYDELQLSSATDSTNIPTQANIIASTIGDTSEIIPTSSSMITGETSTITQVYTSSEESTETPTTTTDVQLPTSANYNQTTNSVLATPTTIETETSSSEYTTITLTSQSASNYENSRPTTTSEPVSVETPNNGEHSYRYRF